jgi:flagellar assembly protein FliH
VTALSQPVRRPSFLASLPQGQEPRATQFQASGPGRPPARPLAPAFRRDPARTGPSPEELAALRAEALERVAHAVEVLRLEAGHLAEQARGDALEIGFVVARRILEAELVTGPEPLFALVRSALRRAGESRRVAIRVHPEDAVAVEGAAAGDQLGPASGAIEVRRDPSLERGDVVVETDFGKVDGRLRTRFEELYRAACAALEEGTA